MQNVNQYKFNVLPCSQVIITEKLYERLVFLVGRSAWIASEHACYFYGREISKNVIFFDEMNTNEDYVNTETNSNNPFSYRVRPECGKLNEELEHKIKTMQGGVVADIHTHPSGVYESENEKEDYRFFSTGDIGTSLAWDRLLKKKNPNIQHVAGLLGVDRIKDVSVAKDLGDNYSIESLERVGEIQLLSKNWSNDFELSSTIKDNLIGLKDL